MKEKILKLREEGKNYNEIKNILGCSKSTISYYCGEFQKEKSKDRLKKRRENKIIQKLDNFKYKKITNIEKEKNIILNEKNLNEKLRFFQKRDKNKIVNINLKQTFNWKDVLNKFGEETFCYLSGEKINLYENDYNFDHIVPVSKGGDNSINNLGILKDVVNRMKSDLSVEELLEMCKKILENNGYDVKMK